MKKQTGFTLIELVIVVIILGLLGAAAVPRFMNATDDARDASVEGVAGGFASAVGIVRAQWELSGRLSAATALDFDGQSVYVGANGYPTATGAASAFTAISDDECKEVLDGVLTSPPTSVAGGSNFDAQRYGVTVLAGSGGTAVDTCIYTLIETATTTTITSGSNLPTTLNNAATGPTEGQGFTYRADTGQVSVFKN